MKIYIPYYDRGWHIQGANSDGMRRIGRYWNYSGWIYGEGAYTTESAAQAYIDKNYFTASKEEYMPLFAGAEATA